MRRIGRLGLGPIATPAGLPIRPSASSVQTMPVGPPAAVATAPPTLGPPLIRTPFFPAPVQKQIIPPYWDAQTAQSMGPPPLMQPVPLHPTFMPGPAPVGPVVESAPPISSTVTAQKVAMASSAQTQAVASGARAALLQQVADQLQQHADAAAAKAQDLPHAAVIQAADAAQANANTAQSTATIAAQTAQQHAADASDAHVAAQQQIASGDAETSLWNQPIDGGYGPVPPRGLFSPPPASTVSTGHPIAFSAAGAGVGFLVGGPVGALVGAAAAYFLGRQAEQPLYQQLQVQTPATPGRPYVGESFVSYQMPDGTWIMNQQEQDAWVAAHPEAWRIN